MRLKIEDSVRKAIEADIKRMGRKHGLTSVFLVMRSCVNTERERRKRQQQIVELQRELDKLKK